MGKKKSHPVDAPKALVALSASAVRLKALKEADATWTKAQEDASKAYDQNMQGAWTRYITALRAHGGKPSAGTDFDKRYDEERVLALRQWNLAADAADKKFARVKDMVGDTPEDQGSE